MKTLYFECNMGAAGDMLMASLYEICDQKAFFLQTMNKAFAPYGIEITPESVKKCGISGTHMHVSIHGEEEGGPHTHAHNPISGEHVHVQEHAELTEHVHTHSADAHDLEQEHSHDADAHSHGQEHSHDTDAHSHEHAHSHDADAHSHGQEHFHDTDAHSHEHAHSHDADAHSHEHAHGDHTHPHVHASYTAILEQIQGLRLPEAVKKNAAAVYELIGNAEAKVHNSTLEQIHFHEVGTLDALADVCGVSLLLYLIAPEKIYASPVHVGSGFVKCAHGVLPVPAPATAELLKGIPFYSGSVTGELLTPTGAALLKHFVEKFQPMPAMTLSQIGYGMGQKEFEIANCVRAFLGDLDAPADTQTSSAAATPDSSTEQHAFGCDDRIIGLSCNLDDMTGESIGFAVEALLDAGALDVYTLPIQMKKGRPGTLFTCLCETADKEKFTKLIFRYTTTRGLRYTSYERAKLTSTFETVSTPSGDIRIKKSTGYDTEHEKAEFEDVRAIAKKEGLTLDEVLRQISR